MTNQNLHYLFKIGILGLILTSGSCSLFETTISRDVQVTWSPGGNSVLIVESSYTTTKPEEPYYYAPASANWTYNLYTCTDGKEARSRIDSFAEEYNQGIITQGGTAQYIPVYWFPHDENSTGRGAMVVFGGTNPIVRFVDQKKTWELPTPRDSLKIAIGTQNLGPNNLSPQEVADKLTLIDAIPSPDGSTLALVYHVSWLYSLDLAYQFKVVGFYDIKTKSPLSFKRVHTDVWSDSVTFQPYMALNSDSQWASAAAWLPDGSGVVIPLRGGQRPSHLSPPSQDQSVIRFIPLDANLPVQSITQIPKSLLPSTSGPIGPDGTMLGIEVTKNATKVQSQAWPLETRGPWEGFEDQSFITVDQAWWDLANGVLGI